MKLSDLKRRVEIIGRGVTIEDDELFEFLLERLVFLASKTFVQELQVQKDSKITILREISDGEGGKYYIGNPRELMVDCMDEDIPLDVSLEDALVYGVLGRIDQRMTEEYDKQMWMVISNHEARLNETRTGHGKSRY